MARHGHGSILWPLAMLFLITALTTSAEDGLASKAPTTAHGLLSAYAHNDYEHPHPLFDALALGFNSVEADIWLVKGELLVAHNLKDVKPERTLQALYLNPLREIIKNNGGHVYTNAATFMLMIDVKSASKPTYMALRSLLTGYTNILSVMSEIGTQTNALTIVISGNRAPEILAAEPVRYAGIDGRLSEITPHTSTQLVPIISEDWKQHFKWLGKGSFPDEERNKLHQIVEQVHQQGRRLRFWASPDKVDCWRELQSAGVDVLGTDDLAGLANFLRPATP